MIGALDVGCRGELYANEEKRIVLFCVSEQDRKRFVAAFKRANGIARFVLEKRARYRQPAQLQCRAGCVQIMLQTLWLYHIAQNCTSLFLDFFMVFKKFNYESKPFKI